MITKKQALSRIIFHIDGDAFFASCEQSTRLNLRGQPIAVGRERGVATAFSYEAKALGVTRGMSGTEITRDFPEVFLVSSDYRKYGLFSARMHRITAQYTSAVEQSSIDECYADMSEVVSNWQEAEKLASQLQDELCTKLGLTISIGIGPNKTIAKIASGMNKPRGITCLSPDVLEHQLYTQDISQVSGIGMRSAPKFHAHGLHTIGQFTGCNAVWVYEHFSKPYVELYRELRGMFVRKLELVATKPKSISKIRAFSPATGDRDMLYSEFARNAEIVASKMRRHRLSAQRIVYRMKLVGGGRVKQELVLDSGISSSTEILDYLERIWHKLHDTSEKYRATSIAVYNLQSTRKQANLFETSRVSTGKNDSLGGAMAAINQQFGRAALISASSLMARARTAPIDISSKASRDESGTPLITSLDERRILYLPYLGVI